MSDIAQRFSNNPILTPHDCPPSRDGLQVECLLNPGVFTFNGEVCLLLRVAERPEQKDGIVSLPILEDGKISILEFDKTSPDIDTSDPRGIVYKGQDYLTTLSHLRLATSKDGKTFTFSDQALFGEGEYESFGIEDCRVSQIGETYFLHYTAVSPHGFGIGLMTTKDWKYFKRHGMMMPPSNKDGALIEECINGKYYFIHRPTGVGMGMGCMWICSSPDLENWGDHKLIAAPRKGMWDCVRVGAGTSPIKTEYGWLELYHAADEKNAYHLGALLLDLEDPTQVIARSEKPIMSPIENYEIHGFYGNVIFSNGHIVEGDKIVMYYGASDEVICRAQFSIIEILQSLNVEVISALKAV